MAIAQRSVGAGVRGQPLVGELGVVGVVRADRDDLLAAVAGLGHEVRVRRPGHRDVGAPHDEVGGVPPVGGLRDVGLVAEHLRARRPAGRRTSRRTTASRRRCRLMKRAPAACEAIDIAGIGENPKTRSGPCCLDRVHVGGADDLERPRPRRPAPGRPCRAHAGSADASRGRRRRRPSVDRVPGGRPSPRGTSRAARRARTGSGRGWASTCTRRRRRRGGSRAARTRGSRDRPSGSRSAGSPR